MIIVHYFAIIIANQSNFICYKIIMEYITVISFTGGLINKCVCIK